jgi:hypothetical protein
MIRKQIFLVSGIMLFSLSGCDHFNFSIFNFIDNSSYTPNNGCDSVKPVSFITLQPGPGEAQDCNTHFSYDAIGHSSWENHNNGLNSIFGVGVYDPNTVIRALIRFELPDTVAASDLKSAKLILHTNKWIPKEINDPIQINIHKMLRSWKQGNYFGGFYEKGLNNAQIDGVTAMERFYGQQDGTEKWSVPGIGMNNIDASQKVYTSTSKKFGDTTSWEFDVTALAQEWILYKESNFGMLLRSPTDQSVNGDNNSYPDIWSGDNTQSPELRPMLILEIKTK